LSWELRSRIELGIEKQVWLGIEKQVWVGFEGVVWVKILRSGIGF
jgi:hypothetical protein